MQRLGYDFVNVGGEVVDNISIVKTVDIVTMSSTNEGQELATVEYISTSKTAKLQEL